MDFLFLTSKFSTFINDHKNLACMESQKPLDGFS